MLARHQATRNRIAKWAIAVRTVALVLLAPLPLATMARAALGEVLSHQKISDAQGGFAGTLGNLDGDGDGMPDSWESRNSFDPRTPGRSTHVGIYCNRSNRCPELVNRFASLGYTTTHWTSPSQVDPNSLAGIDVLFVHNSEASDLASKDAVIGAWVFEGNGLIVEQPNVEGDVAILPPGLDINIWSRSYDGSLSGPDPVRRVQITALGASHPIMSGLTTGDICENFDRVWTSDVSSAYDILGVQETNTDYAAVAAAAYGRGRVVFHTGNFSPGSFSPGSDQYVQQMIDWAAEVEPLIGACCDGITGGCEDDVPPGDCAGALEEWFEGQLCVDLDPPCGKCNGVDTGVFGTMTCDSGRLCETDADCVGDGICMRACLRAIPTVSEWGLVVLLLALLVLAKLCYGRRARRAQRE